MFQSAHINAGAHGSTRLVLDDRDRFHLLERIARALGRALIGYCIMDTHLHVVAEGDPELARNAVVVALRAHARASNTKSGSTGPLLRGAVRADPIGTSRELARALHYVHENPLNTKVPLAPSQVAFEWSSARAYAGVMRSAPARVERGIELLGADARHLRLGAQPLANLDPALTPGGPPALLLAASAQAFGVLAEHVAGPGRSERLVAARRVFVALGHLEAYVDRQIAPTLGRSRSSIQQLSLGADIEGVRIARTLLYTPELRARLERAASPTASPERPPTNAHALPVQTH